MHLTRESIIVNALRSFCVAFAAAFGVLLSILAVFIFLTIFSEPAITPEKSTITIRPDAQGNQELLHLSSPAILRIDIHGVIGCGDLTTDSIESILFDSEQDALLKNHRIKGILLHLDTPGGTVTDADGIYRSLLKYKAKHQIPVYAYVDGMCASGGVYIASAADKIYASTPSVYGSVGVVLGPNFNLSQAMEKIGVSSLTLTEGKDKDMLNPFRPWKVGEEQSLKDVMGALYEEFVTIASSARPMLDKNLLITEYGAQIYIAAKAQSLGYIDEANSTYSAALSSLTKTAAIAETQPYQVVSLSSPHSLIEQFMQGDCSLMSGKITHVLQLGHNTHPDLNGKFLYLYQP